MIATLDHTEPTAEHIQTFWFKPEHPIRYTAGQFIELTLPHEAPDDRGTRRWFTLSSSPTEPLLSITTKLAERPSSFKRMLFGLKSGDKVHVSETMGDFVLPRDKDIPLLFVVGGIGVTPVHSMVKWLVDNKQKRTAELIYAVHQDQEIAFRPLFDKYGLPVTYIVQQPSNTWHDPTGSLSSSHVLNAANKYKNPLMYLSGPEEMVEILVAELKTKGIQDSQLVTDYFPGYGVI